MSARFTFQLESDQRSRDFPHKIIIGQSPTETSELVLLKFLAYVLFFRDRLQMGINLHTDHIPFTPDLVQLDYELHPQLWVECGEFTLKKLDKLAVKIPEADIWIVRRSQAQAELLLEAIKKKGLRTDRYGIIGFNEQMFDETLALMTERNEFFWSSGSIDPPRLQFEFNGLWFDTEFEVLRHGPA